MSATVKAQLEAIARWHGGCKLTQMATGVVLEVAGYDWLDPNAIDLDNAHVILLLEQKAVAMGIAIQTTRFVSGVISKLATRENRPALIATAPSLTAATIELFAQIAWESG